jgi:hypothetical protein
MGEVNIDEFFCPNEAYPDYGKRGKGNIRLKEYYGKQDTLGGSYNCWYIARLYGLYIVFYM